MGYILVWVLEAVLIGGSFLTQSSIVQNVKLANTLFTPYLMSTYQVVFAAFVLVFFVVGSIFVRRREFFGAIQAVVGVAAAGVGTWLLFFPPQVATITGAYLPILALLATVIIQFVVTLMLARKSVPPESRG